MRIILLLLFFSFVIIGNTYAQEENKKIADINEVYKIYDEELLKLMLKSFLYTNNLKKAYKVATYGLKLFPDNTYWLEKSAEIALWLGNYKDALFFYKRLYQITGNKELENKVLDLALQIFDYETALDILDKKLKNKEFEYIKEYAYVVNITGEYKKGYETLKYILQNFNYKTENLIRYLYQFSYNLGNHNEAIKYLQILISDYKGKPYDFINLADLYLYKGQFYKALNTLIKGANIYKKNLEILETISDVAWGLDRRDIAAKYSKKLINIGDGRLVDYIRVVDYFYIEKKDYQKAIYFIKQALKRFKNLYLAKTYIYIKSEEQNWQDIANFIENLDKDLRERLLKNSYIAYLYAYSLEQTGQYDKAISLYEKSLKTSFSISRLKSLLLLFIDLQKTDKLNLYLKKYKHLIKEDTDLLYIYVLGYITIQNTVEAKNLLSKLLKKRKDVSTYLLYADILEVSGQTDRAKHIRYKVWKKLKNTKPKTKPQIENYLRTASYFLPPKKFRNLLEKYKNSLDPETYWNIKYGFLINLDAQDKVYYLSRRYDYLKNWIKMNLALLFDDRTRQLYLIEKYPETIPIRDRVEAAVRTGQIGLAKKLAFKGLKENPRDYQLYKWLRDLYMQYSGYLKFSTEYFFRNTVNQGKIDLYYRHTLQNRHYLILKSNITTQSSSDRSQYINVPSTDSYISLAFKRLTDRGYIKYTLGVRNAFDDFVFSGFSYSSYIKDRWSILLKLYVNSFADDSVYLILGGMKTGISLDNEYMLNDRTYLNLTLYLDRFYGQDGTYLGYGNLLELQGHYKLRVSYPDFSFRGYITSGIYSETDGNKGNITRLSPNPNPAILPEDFVEFGGEFYFGYDNRYLYTRTVRPFMRVGVFYNSITHLGYNGEFGIGGILTKSDNLDAGISFYRGFTGVLDQYISVFVEYRKWF